VAPALIGAAARTRFAPLPRVLPCELPMSAIDTFAPDRMPHADALPQLVFDTPALQALAKRSALNVTSELLDAWLARGHGHRPCLIGSDGRCWTYAEVAEQVNRMAHVLVSQMGLVPGNRVLLRGANSPRLAMAFLAVFKAGGIAVGTMPLLRARELGVIIDKAQISLALCDARLADELQQAQADHPVLQRVMLFNGGEGSPLEAAAAQQPAAFDAWHSAPEDIGLMAFTSGTTGQPKAAMHTHRDMLAACLCWPPHVLKASADDVFIGSPPLAFTFGLGGLLCFPLHIGACAVLIEKASPDVLLAEAARHGASVMFTAPTSYRAMAGQAAQHDLSPLRKCVSAGEALPAATRALWLASTGLNLIDGIGSTELFHIFISADETLARGGATGVPVPGYRAALWDDEGREVPRGTVGRLAIQGPTGCKYLDDPRQAQYVQRGWNLTGDAYRQDDDGQFVYQARTDDMIISGGYNIAGPEVESALLMHPAVAECGVVGVADDERGQIVKAFVVLKPGHAGDEAMARTLQDFVKQTIAPYKYPRAVSFCETLPRTETGKLQRFKLREAR